jgi:poly-gamma-glutamate synthesis protein (capsule biosynthesis protein)
VVIAFAGDVNFEGVMRNRLDADPSTALREVAPTFTAADLAMVNLETAITNGGSAQSKDFTFRAPPEALDALRAAGIDVATEANNHGLDFGAEGLQDSLAARAEKQFPVIGIGQDIDDAFTPYRVTLKGQRIAIIGATQVLDSSLIDSWTAGPGKPGVASAKLVDRLVAEVAKARADSDTVIVYLHWGIEKNTCPSADQQSIATTLVTAGADIVVGTHAHRLQGGGRMGQAFVHYGMGNFAFYAGTSEAARTGILLLTVTGRDIDTYQWLPAHISERVPTLLDGGAADEALAYWNGLRDCTGLAT